ncbi:uncharacterized protein C6orf141 homolog isoform X2 [Tamandua tetradactyla]|uniref:uncharacterized protein C6orf141 homolog isoform X2 n=1 Tax=Tamandua tetradactyla TaxID=48850 RepID=UPI004053ECDF
MNDSSTRMENPGSCETANPAGFQSPGQVWEPGREVSLALGPSNPGAAGARGSRGGAQENWPPTRAPGPRAAENLNCESWVREKVLFLLHPERWLGTQRGPAQEEVAGGEHLPQARRDGPEPGGSSLSPQETRVFGGQVEASSGAPPRDPAAPPKSVLVRIVDYQVTQEVLQTAWTTGRLTTRTEERSITAVTVRTSRE